MTALAKYCSNSKCPKRDYCAKATPSENANVSVRLWTPEEINGRFICNGYSRSYARRS